MQSLLATFKPTKIVLYDFEWQALRTSLDFSTVDSTFDSCRRVREYASSGRRPSDIPDINRVWRALNLLSAVRMGFSGSRKIVKSIDAQIRVERKDRIALTERLRYSLVFKTLKAAKEEFVIDSTEKRQEDVRNASTEDLQRVYYSLHNRYEGSGRSRHRLELLYYLTILEDELERRNLPCIPYVSFISELVASASK